MNFRAFGSGSVLSGNERLLSFQDPGLNRELYFFDPYVVLFCLCAPPQCPPTTHGSYLSCTRSPDEVDACSNALLSYSFLLLRYPTIFIIVHRCVSSVLSTKGIPCI
ncbi:hypothetical protein BGS_0935 [Beggiatoa sp. SS]|nr:hypothetical protein BGS_0935 [Beggiatoa sp. SS]